MAHDLEPCSHRGRLAEVGLRHLLPMLFNLGMDIKGVDLELNEGLHEARVEVFDGVK